MIAWDEYLEKLISVPDVMDEISLSYDCFLLGTL